MLTKTDLSQIKLIIEGVIKEKVDPKLEKLELKMDKEFRKVHQEIKYNVNFLDKDYLKLKKQVTRVETVLQLPPLVNF
jgi:hypothetical protein